MVFKGFNHTKTFMPRFAPRVTTASLLAFVAMAAAASAALPARAQEAGPTGLFDRIFSGSERFGGGSERAVPSDRTAQMSDSDLMLRLDRLETQIRQLTGDDRAVAVPQSAARGPVAPHAGGNGLPVPGIERRRAAPVRPCNRDHKLRRRRARPPTGRSGRRGDAFDPTQNPNAPARRTRSARSTQPALSLRRCRHPWRDDADEPVGAPGGRAAGAPLDLATMGPPGGAPGQRAAQSQCRRGRSPRCRPRRRRATNTTSPTAISCARTTRWPRTASAASCANIPSDRLAGDATYWLGESLFQRQRYRDAAEAFLNVSTKYEASAKAPEALLRLGQSLAALGEKEAACASLGEVLRKYPRASASVKQGVEREQKRVRC